MCVNRLCLSFHWNFSWLKWCFETVFHLRHSSAVQSFKLVFKMRTGSRAWTVLIIRHAKTGSISTSCSYRLLYFLEKKREWECYISFSLTIFFVCFCICRNTAVGLMSCFCYGGWMGKFLSFPISQQTELNILGLWMKLWWAMATSVQMLCAHLVCSENPCHLTSRIPLGLTRCPEQPPSNLQDLSFSNNSFSLLTAGWLCCLHQEHYNH